MQGPERTKRKAASNNGQGAKYRMLADGYFPGYGVATKDDELFYNGTPGKHMLPLNAAAEKAYNAMATAKGLPLFGEPAEASKVRAAEAQLQATASLNDTEKAAAEKSKSRPV